MVVLAYYAPLARASLAARFAFDDMMNMAGYWSKGWLALIAAQFEFWSNYYRPMAGLVYLPLFDLFGLDPLPYRIVITVFLGANALLAYYAARLLCRSSLVALLTGVLTAYHGRMQVLHYNTSQIYDVLCFFFWFLGLVTFLRARSKGSYLGAGSLIALSIFYICCLNAKEMGVTLPLMLFAYETVYSGRALFSGAVQRTQLIRLALPIIVTGLLTIPYVLGKMTGPDAMSSWPAYKPVFTIGRFLDNNAHFTAELLYQVKDLSKGALVAVWAVIACLAFRRRRSWLRWALILIVVGALPISFSPLRGAGCLNIPLFGFAFVAATTVSDLFRFLSRQPIVRRLNAGGAIRMALCLLFIGWHANAMWRGQQAGLPYWEKSQDVTWVCIQEMQRIAPEIRRGSRIAILKDPGLDWEMYFITQLVLRDRELRITLQQTHSGKLTPEEVAGYDHVLAFDEKNVLHLLR